MIIFMVASFQYNNTGMGGHYYSVMSIFQEMRKHQSIHLIAIGDLKPAAIDFTIENVSFYRISRFFKKNEIKALHKTIIEKKAVVIHCFDTYSFLVARMLKNLALLKIVSTKCGGPRPIFHYYPRIRPDTVFSPQEVDYFSKRSVRYNLSKPRLLPNRVSPDEPETDRRNSFRLPSTTNQKVIRVIRIARICRAYEESIFQSMALARQLREMGFETNFFLIGFIQDASVLSRIKEKQTSNDHILTEPGYTHEAARYIYDTDIVVATGRGVMEACQSAKIICCPVKGAQFPYLMDKKSFEHFFYYNFSPRAGIPSESQGHHESINSISKLLRNDQLRQDYNNEIKDIYKTYFDVSQVLSEYASIYQEKELGLNPVIEFADFCLHRWVSLLKLGGRQLQHVFNYKFK